MTFAGQRGRTPKLKAQFKYTFPIEKAERRADGLYITGLASGPEIDLEGERVAPEAVASFARQIEEAQAGGFPLTYRDAHLKDGVLIDLGQVTKAWLTPELHLGIEVKLDEDNPAAVSLFKQIKRGKQYGMSVAGHVIDWADEWVAEVGQIVRTYKNVVLTEISNTTRPAWFPSFGSVLSKAIKDAAEAESAEGDNTSMDEELRPQDGEAPAESETAEEQVVVEKTDDAPEAAAEGEAESTESAEAETVEAEAVETAADEAAESTDEAVAEETNETPTVSAAALTEALAGFQTYMANMLHGLGVAPAPVAKSVSEDETESTLEKALSDRDARITGLETKIEELTKSLGEATARIEELENSPAAPAPSLIERHQLDDVEKALNEMSPSERLRVGLRARYDR